MPFETIIRHCAPTLAGIKIGSLFTYSYDSLPELHEHIAQRNALLNEKGVYFRLLRTRNGVALVYVYRKRLLMQQLEQAEIRTFLAEWGYDGFTMDACFSQLEQHLQDKEFPHEIGIFLGYPLSDIRAFIANKGANPEVVGYWKVYSNAEQAMKIFDKYRKCTAIYAQKYADGFEITKLTVAG